MSVKIAPHHKNEVMQSLQSARAVLSRAYVQTKSEVVWDSVVTIDRMLDTMNSELDGSY